MTVPSWDSPASAGRVFNKLTSLYSLKFLPLGFAQMVMLDDDFQKKYYNFTFVRREFLGEVRCLVIDVQPKENPATAASSAESGLRIRTTISSASTEPTARTPRYSYYLHFDSWRLNMRPGLWLPAYIYSEESDMQYRMAAVPALQGSDAFMGI